MPARRSWRGRDNCNDDSIGIELEGLEGEPFEAAQYEALAAPAARRSRSAIRSRTWPATSTSRRAASTTRAPGFDWALLRARWLARDVFPAAASRR